MVLRYKQLDLFSHNGINPVNFEGLKRGDYSHPDLGKYFQSQDESVEQYRILREMAERRGLDIYGSRGIIELFLGEGSLRAKLEMITSCLVADFEGLDTGHCIDVWFSEDDRKEEEKLSLVCEYLRNQK